MAAPEEASAVMARLEAAAGCVLTALSLKTAEGTTQRGWTSRNPVLPVSIRPSPSIAVRIPHKGMARYAITVLLNSAAAHCRSSLRSTALLRVLPRIAIPISHLRLPARSRDPRQGYSQHYPVNLPQSMVSRSEPADDGSRTGRLAESAAATGAALSHLLLCRQIVSGRR